jgi:hypothetical protein
MFKREDSDVVIFELRVDPFVVFPVLLSVGTEGNDRVVDLSHSGVYRLDLDAQLRAHFVELTVDRCLESGESVVGLV